MTARSSITFGLARLLFSMGAIVLLWPALSRAENIKSLLSAERSARAKLSDIETEKSPTLAVESITDLSSRGLHFQALNRLYQADDADLTLADKLSGARSAWALGLVDPARRIWDEIFSDSEFNGPEKSRAVLARSILELQEGEFDHARSFAEREAESLESSDLRAQFWLVVAESLKEQGALSRAEEYYQKAADEGGSSSRGEALYLLGEAQLKLGMVNDARYSFAGIEAGSQYASQALRRLAEIDLLQQNFDGVLTWVTEGREGFPDQFNDPWVFYAHISALLQSNRAADAEKELAQFRTRFNGDNTWVSLAESAFEAARALEGPSIESPPAGGQTARSAASEMRADEENAPNKEPRTLSESE